MTEKARLQFVDMFRGFSVLVMIQGHVSNSTIFASIRRTSGFHYLDLLNGMIAASFIFASGFAFALVIDRKLEDFLHWHKSLWQYVGRLLFVLGLGYWLHLPFWSLQKTLHLNEAQALRAFGADVLQCIALSLFFCLFVTFLLRNRKRIAIFLLLVGIGIVLWTPFLYDTDPQTYTSQILGTYITAHHNPLFPLFSWSAFLFLGEFLGWVYLEARKQNRERKLFTFLLITGAIMLIGGFALFYVPWQYHTYADPAKSSPRQFMLKLGWVWLLLSALWFYEQRFHPKKSWLAIVGQESLFVYGLHLLIVYGNVFVPFSFASKIGPNLTYGPSLLLSLITISLMVLAALGWHWLKTQKPQVAKAIFYGVFAIWLIGFLIR
ncbi:MAG TPA: heparan-alpha-glucosaminide N-acetyltransferase domain-containing protein [Acidobacteriota bacterium]|nr:heparan-alpha-glucosaminide N-acetyltransferase domain-containing protein [Acidobacteriota bacterium]